MDEAGDLTLKRLEKVAVNVLAVAEGVVDLLNIITIEDYGAFWAPSTCPSRSTSKTID